MTMSITYSRVRGRACARIRAIAPPDGRNGRYTPTHRFAGIFPHLRLTNAVQPQSSASEAAMPSSADYPHSRKPAIAPDAQ